MEQVEIVIRDYDPDTDNALIYSTWTKNCFYADKNISLSKKDWFIQKTREIRDLLYASRTYVACFKDDPNAMLGYAVFFEGQLQWIYIKRDFRGTGIEGLLTKKGQKNEKDGNTEDGIQERPEAKEAD